MRSLATTIVLIGPLAASGSAATEQDTMTITGSFVPARLIERTNPLYPNASVYAGKGGWVRISFCIDAAGAVTDPVIEDSSRADEFEQAAVSALRHWKYQPARFGETSIRQCGTEVMLSFEIPGSRGNGVRPSFAQRWKAIATLITEGRLDEAASQIEALDVWNNYEEARRTILRSYVARARSDSSDELRDVTAALIWRDKLEPELLTALLHRSFVLNMQLGRMAAALTSYSTLKDAHAESLTDQERQAGERLVEVARGDAPLATPGAIAHRTAADKGPPFWSTELLRPAFQFEAVAGELSRVDVRCKDHWYTSPFSTDQVWRIPASWGACSLTVFGKDGTTLKLIEFSKG